MRRRIALPLALLLTACGKPAGAPATVRLGYFANLTHAPAIVAVRMGYIRAELPAGVLLETRTFNAGPEAVEALFSGGLDVAYIGPGPTLNAWAQSHGEAIRVVAGAASGGAALVVLPSIATPAQLKGSRLATPQMGNTQDVALRAWLRTQGLTANLEGGGDVAIVPQANAQTLETFRAGRIQGAWVPEPWATRLVLEGGGRVLVDERSLWEGGRFVTTLVVARGAFLREHPDLVRAVLRGHVRALAFIHESAAARDTVNAGLAAITGRALGRAVLDSAWSHITFTDDPLEATLRRNAEAAHAVGLLDSLSLDGLFDTGPLAAAKRP